MRVQWDLYEPNVRNLKTELDPGSWIADVPFKTGLLFGLCHKLKSSAFFPLRAKYMYCDNDFVDEWEEAHSSSGVLNLALGCEISVTFEIHLKHNLSPGFILDPHE